MYSITVAARDSCLAQKQVQEVYQELLQHVPDLQFITTLLKTTGDLDLNASLVDKDKSDFFTKEVDALVLQGVCDVGIHSAKDLPEPMHESLQIVALTKGVDPSDVLVLRKQETLDQLPYGACIGTSSLRRMDKVKSLREDFIAKDIRGTIEQRLKQLYDGKYDAVIVAKAALIRLDLLSVNWIQLQGDVAPMQGKLAIVARKDNQWIKKVFSLIDTQKVFDEKCTVFRNGSITLSR